MYPGGEPPPTLRPTLLCFCAIIYAAFPGCFEIRKAIVRPNFTRRHGFTPFYSLFVSCLVGRSGASPDLELQVFHTDWMRCRLFRAHLFSSNFIEPFCLNLSGRRPALFVPMNYKQPFSRKRPAGVISFLFFQKIGGAIGVRQDVEFLFSTFRAPVHSLSLPEPVCVLERLCFAFCVYW